MTHCLDIYCALLHAAICPTVSIEPFFITPQLHLIISYILSVNYDNYSTTFVLGGGDRIYRFGDKKWNGTSMFRSFKTSLRKEPQFYHFSVSVLWNNY